MPTMNPVTEQDRETAREIAAQVINHECVDGTLDREMLEAFRGDPKAAQSFADDFVQRAGSAEPCQHIISAIAQALADARNDARVEVEAVVVDKLHFTKTVLSNIKTGTAIADERHFGSKQVAFQEILDAIQKEQTQ